MYKIIGSDQKEYGPISADQIRQWIAQSRADQQTQVKPEGATDWQPLGSLPEFAAAFAAPRPTPTPQTAGSYVETSRTSGMAITSLVLGLLGACGILSLVGLILGIVALVQIKNSGGRLKGKGMALAGIILSAVWLVALIIAVPMWVTKSFTQSMAKAKERAQKINCINNEKQIGIAFRGYAIDHNDQFPPAATWCDALQPELGTPAVFRCPAATPNSSRCGYSFNRNLDGKKLSEVDSQTVMAFESDAGWNSAGGLDSATYRHGQKINVILVDGSVQSVSPSELSNLRWEP